METIKQTWPISIAILLLSILSCQPEHDGTEMPAMPVIEDLSYELDETARASAIRFEVSVPEAETAWVEVTDPAKATVFEKRLKTASDETIDLDGLEPETLYEVTATAANGDVPEEAEPAYSASMTIEIMTFPVPEPEYLTLGEVTSSSYSFRVFSKSETGFWFTSGEYDALEYLVPGWSTDDKESMIELLEYLWPFEGFGDMTIECVDGEQPEWAEMPIEVIPDSHYFIMAADKDSDGNVVGKVHFLDFNTI